MTLKYVAIHTGADTYLDHIGVLAATLSIPLIVTDPHALEIAHQFYPQAQVTLMDLEELTIDFLATHYDVIFESGHRWSFELFPLFQVFCQKEMRFVYCPHGNSDKESASKTVYPKDISLVYGQHMTDILEQKEDKALRVRCGNFRLSFYQKHAAFYDALVPPHSFSPHKKTVLYAPTWKQEEEAETFFAQAEELIYSLMSPFNVIVKLHPFLEEWQPARTCRLQGKIAELPEVLSLSSFPLIYPLLKICDVYIGDTSSIGYDFLAFDRPLYFTQKIEGPLSRCGQTLKDVTQAGRFIEDHFEKDLHHFSKMRQEAYRYAFGEERGREEIVGDIKKALLQGAGLVERMLS